MIQTAKVATKHAGGRPTKKTPEMVENLRSSISDGLSFKAAANMAGINTDTFWDWMKNDAEFSDTMKSARARAVADSVAVIRTCKPGWQAMAWWLERIEYEDWGSKQRIEHAGVDGDTLKLVFQAPGSELNGNGNHPTGNAPNAIRSSNGSNEVPCTRLRAPVGKNGS